MSTIIRETKLGCGRSLVNRLIAILIVVPLFCVLVCFPLWLVTRLDLSVWVLGIAGALFLLILIGGGVGLVGVLVYRRARQLDALFIPLGLTGNLYQLFFRQYHGKVEGRGVSVYYYRGPTLEIEVATSLQTRLALTERDVDNTFFARLFGREPLSLADESLNNVMAFALDETWARRLLGAGDVSRLLQRLIGLEDHFLRRQMILEPGLLRLKLHGSRNLFRHELGQEEVEGWIEDLLALVQLLERMPGPELIDSETKAEQLARSMRGRDPRVLPAITLIMVVGSVLCAGLVGVLAFLWAVAQ